MLYRVEGTGGACTVDGLDRLCEVVRLTYGEHAIIEACSPEHAGRVRVGAEVKATVRVSIVGQAQAGAATVIARRGLDMACEHSARVNVRGLAAEA